MAGASEGPPETSRTAMKRALRSALRGSSPSTRARRPPLPLSPVSANIAAVGNQLSRFASQQQGCGGATAAVFSSAAVESCAVTRSAADPRLAASRAWGAVLWEGGSGRGGRGRRRRGESRDARFDPGSSGRTLAAAAAALAAAVAAGGGGKQVDCEYPEGTKFEDVYFCSGRALGSGEWGAGSGCGDDSVRFPALLAKPAPRRRRNQDAGGGGCVRLASCSAWLGGRSSLATVV